MMMMIILVHLNLCRLTEAASKIMDTIKTKDISKIRDIDRMIKVLEPLKEDFKTPEVSKIIKTTTRAMETLPKDTKTKEACCRPKTTSKTTTTSNEPSKKIKIETRVSKLKEPRKPI